MPIDPKQIEELKAAAGEAPADFEYDDEDSDGNWRYYSSPKAERFYDLAREAVPALLAEREEMLSLLRDLRDGLGAALVECYEGETFTIAGHLRRLLDDPRLAAFLK